LIVSDEVFQMSDAFLKQNVKTAIPNTFNESNLLEKKMHDASF
jgi:hypothetical protein